VCYTVYVHSFQILFNILVAKHTNFYYLLITLIGERQLQLTKVLERTPSASFVDALETFVAWMVGAEQLLASETFVVDELEVMEHQLSQYMVRLVFNCLFNRFFNVALF